MQINTGDYPHFLPPQIDALLRAWGIDVPGNAEVNLQRVRNTVDWMVRSKLADPASLPGDAALLDCSTGGVVWAIYPDTGEAFDARWSSYRVELVLTPPIERFRSIPWLWPIPGIRFLDAPRQPDWHPAIPFLVAHNHVPAWAILRFRLWKEGTRGYLEGHWVPHLQRAQFDLCDFDLYGKVNPDLAAMARTITEQGRGGRPPGLTAVEPLERITMICDKTREFMQNGLPATQAAIGLALNLSESTVKRYLRDAGFRDWQDFLTRGL